MFPSSVQATCSSNCLQIPLLSSISRLHPLASSLRTRVSLSFSHTPLGRFLFLRRGFSGFPFWLSSVYFVAQKSSNSKSKSQNKLFDFLLSRSSTRLRKAKNKEFVESRCHLKSVKIHFSNMSADNQSAPPAGSSSIPPPAPSASAPGQNQAQSSHMPPPPLPPVIIPQNTNPIPTAITSPMSVSGVTSPTSAGGFVRRAAPEPNKRALYVGGLDPRVTEEILKQIFETTGHVQNVKIIPDKNVRIPLAPPPPPPTNFV